jgi:hypothetical protein
MGSVPGRRAYWKSRITVAGQFDLSKALGFIDWI